MTEVLFNSEKHFALLFIVCAKLLQLAILLIDTSGLFRYPALKQLENWTYDARLNFTRIDTVDDRIVIVDIDENSLAEVGRWPWGRDKLATIVENLFDHYQADVVGFDIVFAEKDERKGYLLLEVGRGGDGRAKLTRWRFREMPARPMLQVELEAHRMKRNDLERSLRSVLTHLPADGVVRIRITGRVLHHRLHDR